MGGAICKVSLVGMLSCRNAVEMVSPLPPADDPARPPGRAGPRATWSHAWEVDLKYMRINDLRHFHAWYHPARVRDVVWQSVSFWQAVPSEGESALRKCVRRTGQAPDSFPEFVLKECPVAISSSWPPDIRKSLK